MTLKVSKKGSIGKHLIFSECEMIENDPHIGPQKGTDSSSNVNLTNSTCFTHMPGLEGQDAEGGCESERFLTFSSLALTLGLPILLIFLDSGLYSALTESWGRSSESSSVSFLFQSSTLKTVFSPSPNMEPLLVGGVTTWHTFLDTILVRVVASQGLSGAEWETIFALRNLDLSAPKSSGNSRP